jgi:hypothetical protein
MKPHDAGHMDALLHQERFSPEELAELIDVDLNTIRHAAFTGDLAAMIADHDILYIERSAVIAWLNRRGA